MNTTKSWKRAVEKQFSRPRWLRFYGKTHKQLFAQEFYLESPFTAPPPSFGRPGGPGICQFYGARPFKGMMVEAGKPTQVKVISVPHSSQMSECPSSRQVCW